MDEAQINTETGSMTPQEFMETMQRIQRAKDAFIEMADEGVSREEAIIALVNRDRITYGHAADTITMMEALYSHAADTITMMEALTNRKLRA